MDFKNGHSRMEIYQIMGERTEVDMLKRKYKSKLAIVDESSDEYENLMDKIFELKARTSYLDHKYAHVNNIFADPKHSFSYYTPKESSIPDFKFECQVCGGDSNPPKSSSIRKPSSSISELKTEKQLKEEADEWTSHITQPSKKKLASKKAKGKK